MNPDTPPSFVGSAVRSFRTEATSRSAHAAANGAPLGCYAPLLVFLFLWLWLGFGRLDLDPAFIVAICRVPRQVEDVVHVPCPLVRSDVLGVGVRDHVTFIDVNWFAFTMLDCFCNDLIASR